jgi:hypothetical protein
MSEQDLKEIIKTSYEYGRCFGNTLSEDFSKDALLKHLKKKYKNIRTNN